MADLIKQGPTWFPVQNDEGETRFIRSAGKKLQFKDGTVVVYMPPRQAKDGRKIVMRDETFSVKYKWGKKEGPMSRVAFQRGFSEGFVNKVFQTLFG